MYHVALTPHAYPLNALSAKAETLMGALAELLKALDTLQHDEWFVCRVLETAKEAADNLENYQPAKGSWSDMGSEDDAFSIDIFCAEEESKVTCKLSFDVTYDPTKTNPATLAELFDFMLGQSLGSDVLDGQGETHVGPITCEATEVELPSTHELHIARLRILGWVNSDIEMSGAVECHFGDIYACATEAHGDDGTVVGVYRTNDHTYIGYVDVGNKTMDEVHQVIADRKFTPDSDGHQG